MGSHSSMPAPGSHAHGLNLPCGHSWHTAWASVVQSIQSPAHTIQQHDRVLLWCAAVNWSKLMVHLKQLACQARCSSCKIPAPKSAAEVRSCLARLMLAWKRFTAFHPRGASLGFWLRYRPSSVELSSPLLAFTVEYIPSARAGTAQASANMLSNMGRVSQEHRLLLLALRAAGGSAEPCMFSMSKLSYSLLLELPFRHDIVVGASVGSLLLLLLLPWLLCQSYTGYRL